MPGSCWTKQGKPKKRYGTRRAAKQARRHYIETLASDPGAPYRCPSGEYFHLGHYPTSPAIRARLRDRHRGAQA